MIMALFMKLQKFDQMYAGLNSAQKEAVDAVEGPVVVAAGPGTGKTQMLALRIANILRKTDASPENILALTFTNAGVAAMRQRLAGIVGVETAYRVSVYTFHSFCEEQIGKNMEEFAQFASAQVADEVARTQIVERIVKKEKLEKLKTFASDGHYIRDIMHAIDELKREGVSPDDFRVRIAGQKEDILADTENTKYYYQRKYKEFSKGDLKKDAFKDIEKNLELAQIYAAYQEALGERKLYDFSDMVMAVVSQIETDDDYRFALQEQYTYVLVDEHQDTNDAQSRLLLALANAPHLEGRPNIFAVGDVKQSIYRFAGASIANFQNFHQNFRDVLTIELTENYRSTQNVLDASFAVMAQTDATPAGAKLNAARKLDDKDKFGVAGAPVRICQLPDYEAELEFVIADIKEKIAGGVAPRDIAVFYRNNAHLAQIAAAAERAGVPYVVASTQNALVDNDLRTLFWLLRAVAEPTDDEVLARAMIVDFVGLDTIDALSVFVASKYQRAGSLLARLADEKFLSDASVVDSAQFVQFAQKIAKLHKAGQNMLFDEFFEKFVREIGFLEHILSAPNHRDKVSKLTRVFGEVKKHIVANGEYRLSDFLSALDAMERYNIPLNIPWDPNSDGVRLMTAHGAKGLEFDLVYITNAIDSVWGKRRNMRKFNLPIDQVTGDVEDERRLFFVAMTRAKRELVISHAQYSSVGKVQIPVRFIEQLPEECISQDEAQFAQNDRERAEAMFAPRKITAPPFLSAEYIRTQFFAANLSASTLNNYCQSPLLYFFRNIVRLPQAESRPLIFGNLVHGTLEEYFKLGRDGGALPPVEKLLEIFDEQLARTSVLVDDYAALALRGRQILRTYWEQHHAQFAPEVKVEEWIGGVEFVIDAGHTLKLVGKIDKMEILGTEAGRTKVRIIDYKTGTPWSKMDKSGRAKLHRQMTFYKLLLDEYDNGSYALAETQLHFVDPNADDICEIHTITPTDEDVTNLRTEITDFAQNVITGEIINKITTSVTTATHDRATTPLVPLWEALVG